MFETIGVPELLIILAVVMVLFGAGRVGRLGKDLGTSVKEFRRAMHDDETAEATPLPYGAAGQQPYVAPQYAQVAAPEAQPRVDGPQVF
jgi:sec-independent protein translocase protein TatA